MATIKIKLRIVGLYFNKTVTIQDSPNLTVRNVLDEYIRLHPNLSDPGGLDYIRFPGDGSDTVTAFTHHYSGKFDYEGDNNETGPADGPSLGNINRPAGLYTLSEDLEDELSTKTAGLVWQYYVVSPAGVVKSKTPATRGFKLFGKVPPDYDLANGDTIIWRLVVIARAPVL